ncbi:sensor histidine kinase [Polaromonas jejuensis]|uniref:histidine kinase n=1 Tax=Polaromonas jejuensis TaxID=457502 RepID=A0ABW0QC93_9BURK|nr:sensor histidine kinase [Polaromonas jejuensis]
MKQLDSLRLQLLRWLLIPLGLLLVVNAFFSNRTANLTANHAFDSLLVASADTIADQVTVRDGALAVDLPYVALQLLESNLQERIFYRVVAPDGRTLTGYDDLPMPPRRTSTADTQVTYTAQYKGEDIYLVAYYKQVYGLSTTDPVVILVAETGESRSALSRQILIDDLQRQAVLIIAAGLLVWLGLGRGLRPLMELRDSLVKRSSFDLSPIDQTRVQNEIRPLIEALNQHTSRIEKLIESRQRFIADASHQLRTPLSEMRTQVEYTLRQGRPELSHETLATVRRWLDSQTRLIGQLLLMARSDPEAMQNHHSGVANLMALARDTALEHVPAARRKAIDLSFEGPEHEVPVMGNELLLHELMANLIDNAIRYTPAHGAITVRVMQGEWAVLEVEDNGPGIALSEREKVFERFYRGPNKDAQGSGLGLSIVRDICVSHDAQIALDSPAGGGPGLLVRVQFKPAHLI